MNQANSIKSDSCKQASRGVGASSMLVSLAEKEGQNVSKGGTSRSEICLTSINLWLNFSFWVHLIKILAQRTATQTVVRVFA